MRMTSSILFVQIISFALLGLRYNSSSSKGRFMGANSNIIILPCNIWLY